MLLLGCTSSKDTVLPREGPDMMSIYSQHMTAMQRSELRPEFGGQFLPRTGIDHYAGFVREAANEIDSLFPQLPNPTLVMFVYPHLSHTERSPVPGYITSFPLYERIEYALPGEVSGAVIEEIVNNKSVARGIFITDSENVPDKDSNSNPVNNAPDVLCDEDSESIIGGSCTVARLYPFPLTVQMPTGEHGPAPNGKSVKNLAMDLPPLMTNLVPVMPLDDSMNKSKVEKAAKDESKSEPIVIGADVLTDEGVDIGAEMEAHEPEAGVRVIESIPVWRQD
ncbi:MAG: TIGR03751 family conjugal transfer lipoprotein [Gammaproteobacteria bacterium]|nr:TIGR03751 family conjugal transfer lipoprotein [Gammaproteobacteria bacterium]